MKEGESYLQYSHIVITTPVPLSTHPFLFPDPRTEQKYTTLTDLEFEPCKIRKEKRSITCQTTFITTL